MAQEHPRNPGELNNSPAGLHDLGGLLEDLASSPDESTQDDEEKQELEQKDLPQQAAQPPIRYLIYPLM